MLEEEDVVRLMHDFKQAGLHFNKTLARHLVMKGDEAGLERYISDQRARLKAHKDTSGQIEMAERRRIAKSYLKYLNKSLRNGLHARTFPRNAGYAAIQAAVRATLAIRLHQVHEAVFASRTAGAGERLKLLGEQLHVHCKVDADVIAGYTHEPRRRSALVRAAAHGRLFRAYLHGLVLFQVHEARKVPVKVALSRMSTTPGSPIEGCLATLTAADLRKIDRLVLAAERHDLAALHRAPRRIRDVVLYLFDEAYLRRWARVLDLPLPAAGSPPYATWIHLHHMVRDALDASPMTVAAGEPSGIGNDEDSEEEVMRVTQCRPGCTKQDEHYFIDAAGDVVPCGKGV
jgi:hypothetical protein